VVVAVKENVGVNTKCLRMDAVVLVILWERMKIQLFNVYSALATRKYSS